MTNTMQADATVSHTAPGPLAAPAAGLSATTIPTAPVRRSATSLVGSIPRTIAIGLRWLTSDGEPQLHPSVHLMIGPNGGPIWHRSLAAPNCRGGDHGCID